MAFARLEGGPYDGAASTTFPYEPFPHSIALRPCGGCGCASGLHVWALPTVKSLTGHVQYDLVAVNDGEALYRYADLNFGSSIAERVRIGMGVS